MTKTAVSGTVPRMRSGLHVSRKDAASYTDHDCIQVNLSSPRSWTVPTRHGDEEVLAGSRAHIWVHAPYLLNPSSVNVELREKTREALGAQLQAAANVGALGVVVHAGHPTADGTVDDAIAGWREVLGDLSQPVPVLIENTAGGSNGPGRQRDTLIELIKVLRSDGNNVGVCLDTCHAWAAGWDLSADFTYVADSLDGVGLIHANDSKDLHGSARDRHANIGAGNIPLDLIATATQLGADIVVETPGGYDAMLADVEWIKNAHLNR